MQDNNEAPSGTITQPMLTALNGTRPWVLLIAILGFIGAAFVALAGVISLASGAVISGFFTVVSAVAFYFMPALLLIKYASSITSCAYEGSIGAVNNALQRQHSFWRYAGICAIIICVMMVILILLSLAFASMASNMIGALFASLMAGALNGTTPQ